MKLNHSPATIIAKWLIDSGNATDVTKCRPWPVVTSSPPSEPDSVITCKDTQGKLGGRLQDNGETITYFGLCIRVRCVDYTEGWNKASNLFSNLSPLTMVTVAMPKIGAVPATSYKIHCIKHVSGIAHLGQDAKQRNDFIFDSRITITQGA